MPAFNGITLDTGSFGTAMRRLSALNNKTQAENLLSYARTTLSNPRQGSGLLEITPPASAGATGAGAKRQGEAAINRDLGKIFTGVRLKHKRREQWPDVEGIHRRLFINQGSKVRSDRGRGFYHVDRTKLLALRKKLFSHVGRLAAGWLPACQRLGVRAPAWISRHLGRAAGGVRVQLQSPRYEIEMSCSVPPNAPGSELERRVPYAIGYATARAERQIAWLLARDARGAGFRASA